MSRASRNWDKVRQRDLLAKRGRLHVDEQKPTRMSSYKIRPRKEDQRREAERALEEWRRKNGERDGSEMP